LVSGGPTQPSNKVIVPQIPYLTQYCTALLDIAQAFDKVWHSGLLYKIKKCLPSNYYILLKSYKSERSFVIKINEEISNRLPVHSGVPQESLLSPLLYTLYTHDLPTTNKTIIGTFADDTAIFASHDNPTTASSNLQEHLILIEAWLNKCKIKVNESKSTQTAFTLRKGTCPPGTNKSYQHTTKRTGQIPRINLRQQTNLETTHNQENKTNGPKIQRTQVAHRKRIPSLHRKQVIDLQNSHQAHMDLWHTTLGLRQEIQYCHYTASPVQNIPIYLERTMACIQPYPVQI
jgi:hypothetical protein